MRYNDLVTASDFPITDGKVYHLNLKPEELAKDVLIVGDPDRVPLIADEFFVRKEIDRFHRGLRTITGVVEDTYQRVSIVTSGMGTPSLEIVLNELVALNEIDLLTRKRYAKFDRMNIIRVGTSGGLQLDTNIGTFIITEYAIGLDNTGLFYNVKNTNDGCQELEDIIRETISRASTSSSKSRKKIFPYVSRANPEVVRALEKTAQELDVDYKKGVTTSNSGFFANQGRQISRLPLTIPDIDDLLASTKTKIANLRIENMEMESSFLLFFMGALGYRAGAICPIIANRRNNTFTTCYSQNIKVAAQIALNALNLLKPVN
jgi:uridine phosphorylase